MKVLRPLLVPCVALFLACLLLVTTEHLSRSFDYHAVMRAARSMSPAVLIAAVAATAISYLGLVGRDALALRYMAIRMPQLLLWMGASAGSALGNAVGFGVLTGGAVRYRIYGAAGVGAVGIARLMALIGTTFGLGLIGLSGLALAMAAPAVGPMLQAPVDVVLAGGLALLSALALLLIWCRPERPPLRIGRLRVEIPSRGFIGPQLVLGVLDIAGAAMALFVLLPSPRPEIGGYLAIYVVALLLGVIGHTPGGVGIFETVMIFALRRTAPAAPIVAALLLYRLIYFILPLLAAAVMLAAFEMRTVATRLPRWVMTDVSPRAADLVPPFLGVITFTAGAMLLVSGATPAFGTRLQVLATTVPLWAVEAAQLLGSVSGVALLFVARGLLRRLDAAWWLALGLSCVSLLISLAEGLAFLQAVLLAFLILLLLLSRKRFGRPAALFQERFTLGWLVSVGIVMAAVVWVFFFAFRDVPYTRDLWWQFAFHATASRALRATTLAVLCAGAASLWQLLRPTAGRVLPPTREHLLLAEQILRGQDRSQAMLAMMGDKSFLFSESGRAFLMYAKRGRSWVALYDPVGPREEWQDLIARFVALVHAHDGRVAFYQVRPEALPLYLDAGLTLMKLGEEACIELGAFGLSGARRSNLRYALKRGEREGLSVEIIAPPNVGAVLPVLQDISGGWCAGRRAHEKGFSIAAFDPDYVAIQSVILARQNGRPVAFATFMTTDLRTDATVGVMRHIQDTSPYTMEYIFTRLILHLKETGFERLSLGMAPLSGLTPTPLATPWHRIGYLLWRFGGHLYNFRGLRMFKSKFNPEWQPRYLAASGTWGPFLALADIIWLAGNRS